MRQYSTKELQDRFKTLGYVWPKGIHIIGIRAKTEIDNQFCDLLLVFDGEQCIVAGVGTTIPGRPYLLRPMNPKGAAVLKEGQYLNCWKVGLHNKYEALVQCAPVTVYRDSNRDNIINEVKGTEDRGIFGIDIHHAGQNFIAKFIDNFSAGCQVWQDIGCFNTMMTLAKRGTQQYFSYTLLNEF